jgi:hypothetical protein
MVKRKTVDSYVNWAEEGRVLEERHSVVGMRVHGGGTQKIENNDTGWTCINMRRTPEATSKQKDAINQSSSRRKM